MGDLYARMKLVSLKSVSSRAPATMVLSVGFPAAIPVETMPDLGGSTVTLEYEFVERKVGKKNMFQ
jgi:hypothetical protein